MFEIIAKVLEKRLNKFYQL